MMRKMVSQFNRIVERSELGRNIGKYQGCIVAGVCMLIMASGLPSAADEGMWLFNQLPKQQLSDEYKFSVTDDWIEHLMLSSVRFNSGGSASFVSSNGLVLTNHHVAADTLYKLSTAKDNYNDKGFLAEDFAHELKAPDLELNQLVSIEDVTDQVNASVTPKMSVSEASKARQAKMASIEKDSSDATHLRSDVVTLFGGGKYHLYRYKKYTDVRLVWAPESDAAFFGGDADNFEYPRYCLDVTLFRVYENDSPAKITHYLRTEPQGATDGDLIFVSGNPGRTRRIFSAEALAYQRDHAMPRTMNLLRRKENLLQQFALNSPESQRRAKDDLFGIQNSRKAYGGMLAGLQEPKLISDRLAMQSEVISKDPESNKSRDLKNAWGAIADAQARKHSLQTQSQTLRSRLYSIAETLVLMAKEDLKPSELRLREFRDSNRESLLQDLLSPAPMYTDLERVILADELSRLLEDRGGDDEFVKRLLNGQSPRAVAANAIADTKLFDVETREKIMRGGGEAIEKSQDPMIVLAIRFEDEYRRLDEIFDEIEEIERQAYAKVNETQFAMNGDSNYPDATFTLRLAYGVVKGYQSDGNNYLSSTTLGGAFEHQKTHGDVTPWMLPASWHQKKPELDLSLPLNFVSTADIIGGNSGSPVVNRAGNLVGIIFDGNIDSLTADFYYSEERSRAIAVHVASVVSLLKSVYKAGHIVDQMTIVEPK